MLSGPGGFHEGAVPRQRRLAARIAALASGDTLVLGVPCDGIPEALWERVPSVMHGVADPVLRLHLLRRAAELGVADYVTHGADRTLDGVWDTIVLDADGAWGDLRAADVLEHVVPGGVVLVVGRGERRIDHVIPGRHPSPTPVLVDYTPLARLAYPVPIGEVGRYLVRVEASAADEPDAGTDVDGAGHADVGRADAATASGVVHVDVDADRVPVTVVIPTLGRSPWLAQSIRSALGQTARAAAVIVVSDGSAPVTREIAHPFGEAITLIEIERRGQAGAMNEALRHVKTELVAWLDDDDRFLPRKLELQAAHMAAHPDAVFGATHHYAIGPTGDLLEWRPVVNFDPGQTLRLLLGGSHFLGPTVMVRTEHLRALGDAPYDESLTRAQDYGMWMELAARGPVTVLDLALTEVRRHPGNALTPERIALMRTSARRTLSRAVERWPIERMFPGLTAYTSDAERGEATALAYLERAGHLLRVGLVDAALADVAAGLSRRPEDARLRHFHAITRLERGELDEAADGFRAAGRVGAPGAEVSCGLGTIAVFRGDRDAAERHFREAMAADPGFPIAAYNLVRLTEGPRSAPAVRLAERFLARGRPHGYLLSPWPPLDAMEGELVRLRRAENGLDADRWGSR